MDSLTIKPARNTQNIIQGYFIIAAMQENKSLDFQ